MQIRVDLCGWEHECCGDAYEINAVVTRELFLPTSGPLQGNAEYIESHHDLLTGGSTVTGRVVGVEVLGPQGTFVKVTRLPDADELGDAYDDDSGDLTDLATGDVLENESREYIVILDVAGGTELPTERARSAS
jgi:hypothetical protein